MQTTQALLYAIFKPQAAMVVEIRKRSDGLWEQRYPECTIQVLTAWRVVGDIHDELAFARGKVLVRDVTEESDYTV